MKRRQFIVMFGGAAAAWPLQARAQTSGVLHLGIVALTPRTGPNWVAFEQRLQELGFASGQNLAIEFTQSHNTDDINAAVSKLVSENADIILAAGNEFGPKAALAATKTIPIVMIAIDYDPLALGYVASLGRPGSNLTGLYYQQIDLTQKRLQLMKEAVPQSPRMTVFWDSSASGQWQAAQNIAPSLGLDLAGVELSEQPYDYEKALAEAPEDHRGALVALMSPIFFNDRARLAEFTLRHKLPAMFGLREFAEFGALLSYGPNNVVLFKRAAEYVARIAKGDKPADLPVEQPTKFELIFNLKTAKVLGLDPPMSLLLRADEVIE
jgi:putative tryptophan/tyrosine transport system substrate-binding protein